MWLALLGCVALLGGSPAAAVPEAAPPQPQRYTLSLTYTAQTEHQSLFEWCNWGAPIPPASDLIWVCGFDAEDDSDLWSYAARSRKPFPITRTGPVSSFNATMEGTTQQVGRRHEWLSSWIGGEGQYNGVTNSNWSATGRVTGTVSMNGTNPARLKTDMSATKDQHGTQTVTHCSNTGCETTTQDSAGGFIDRAWLKRVNLHKVPAGEFTVSDTSTTTDRGRTTVQKWVFRFTPVKQSPTKQRWQVEVRGQDRWSWGMYTGLRAGVDVDWAHRTTLVIKDGELTSAKGKVEIVEVRPFSEPPGAFDVTYSTSTPRAYDLKKAVKRGKRVELGLWKDNGSVYRVNFSIRAAGESLLDRLRTIGVPYPEATYQTVLARGTIQDSAAPIVPSSPRLVVALRPGVFNLDTDAFNRQLPCLDSGASQQDCFLTRGGQRVTVTELK